MGRTTKIQPAGYAASNFKYASTGVLATESNGDFSAAYTYDNAGRMAKAQETGNVIKSYTYDLNGRRKTFSSSVNSAAKISTSYTYDSLGRLAYVHENDRQVGAYTYDANSNRITLQNGNGTSVSYQYNLANLPLKLENKKGGEVLSSYAYAYQLDGNQASKTDNSGKVTSYAYDGLGRLKSEAESGGLTLAYQYDNFSNRKKLTATGTEVYTVDYTYDKNNRLLQDIKTAGDITETTAYTYDNNGNQLSKLKESLAPAGTKPNTGYNLSGSDASLFTYDGFGRMVSVYSGGKNMEYTYMPNGLRCSKSGGVNMTIHIWDGQDMAMELGGGTMTAKYIRGIGLLESEDAACSRKTYMYNAHGDVVQLADASGNVLWKYDYDAFGNERPVAGQSPALDVNPWRYCGEYTDLETDTVYLRARNYDSSTGRFLTEDTHWNPGNMVYGGNPGSNRMPNFSTIMQSSNLYVYSLNNPVLYQDPSGDFVIVLAPAAPWIIGGLEAIGACVTGGVVVSGVMNQSEKEEAAKKRRLKLLY